MSEIGLSAFFGAENAKDFVETAWQESPIAVHGLRESIAPLTEIPFLASLDALLESWGGKLQVHLPDVSDESSSIDAYPQEARKLFANGMALNFDKVHEKSAVLREWLAAIARDLGLPASTYARCMVYATPDGKGTAPHFDQNINFVIQLQGTKKWWIASNTSVENPTQRHVMGQAEDPELKSYAYEAMPTEMPSEREEIILEPGSMLFVPRGFWHSTEARGEALALNFTFSQPTFADLFTMALRSRLLLSPDWRALADGVASPNSERRQAATAKLDLLLAELAQDIPNWRAEDILGATEGL